VAGSLCQPGADWDLAMAELNQSTVT